MTTTKQINDVEQRMTVIRGSRKKATMFGWRERRTEPAQKAIVEAGGSSAILDRGLAKCQKSHRLG
jgi:hypothetical protein